VIVKRRDGSTVLTATKQSQLFIVDVTNDLAMVMREANDNNYYSYCLKHFPIEDLRRSCGLFINRKIEMTSRD